MDYLLMTLFLIVCLLLIVVVLLQKGRGGGLSGAFGGAGGSSAFGTRTGDVFTWVTIVLVGLFLLLAIVATIVTRPPAGLVAVPTLDPSSWPKDEKGNKISVTMSCGTKGAAIRYTLDEREPTDKSLAYGTSAVTVKYGQTLKARGFRVGMTPSPTVSVTYTRPDVSTQPATGPTGEPAQPVSAPVGG